MKRLPDRPGAGLPVVAGCTVGPNYQRPKVDVPPGYRGPLRRIRRPRASAESLGNEKWWTVYHDPVLQQLIHTALQHNYDVQHCSHPRYSGAGPAPHYSLQSIPHRRRRRGNASAEQNPKLTTHFPDVRSQNAANWTCP